MYRTVRLLAAPAVGLVPSIAAAFLASVFEAAVLAMIVPLIEAVADDRTDLEINLGAFATELTTNELFAFVVIGVVAMTGLYLLANVGRAVIYTRFLRQTRQRLVEAYLESDWPTTRSERQGKLQETLSFARNASVTLNNIGTMWASLASLIVFIGSALVVDARAAVSILVVGVVLTAVLYPVRRYQRNLSRQHAEAAVDVSERVGEIVDNIDDITVFGTRDSAAGAFVERDATQLTLALRSRVIQGAVGPLYRSVGLLVVVGAVLLAQGSNDLDTTSFGAAALLLYRSVGVGQRLQSSVAAINEGVGSVEGLEATMAAYEEHRVVFGDRPLSTIGRLTVDSVSFAYDVDSEALDSVSLDIGPGELIGLAGPSGSGKSTLAQILVGLRQPTGGNYAVNGHPPIAYREVDWHRSVATVPQVTRIVHATVEENIRYFRDSIDHAVVEHAARAAGIHDMILELPDDYGTPIGPSTRALSGGQIQRIGIARAFAGRPDLIVLDEPTSSLDPASETIVHDTLRGLRGEQIVIVIAHRRSTLECCDRIVLLDRGRVAADGRAGDILAMIDAGQAAAN